MSLVLLLAALALLCRAVECDLTVLHITDIHLDLDYEFGSSALCARPPCCKGRANGGTKDGGSYGGEGTAGKLGSFKCDSPLSLLQSALSAAKSVKPDIVVWTRDTLPHLTGGTGSGLLRNETKFGRTEALRILGNASDTFERSFAPYFRAQGGEDAGLRGKIFPVLGSGDFYPADTDPGPGRHDWLTSALADGKWGDWLGSQEARRTFAYGGFYKAPIQLSKDDTGLRAFVIGLNTEVCHVKNFHAFSTDLDAREQLEWLRLTLAELDAEGAKVVLCRGAVNLRESQKKIVSLTWRLLIPYSQAILIGHVPPGLWSGCWGEYSEAYEAIVSSYTNVVAAQLYGHHHSGSFRVLRDQGGSNSRSEAKSAASVAYVTFSLTPYKNQFPSFRVYNVALGSDTRSDSDGASDSGESREGQEGESAPPALPHPMVTSFTQYFLDLSKYASGPPPGGVISWYVSFTAPQSLGIPDLRPETWHIVGERILSNKTIRNDFVRLEANGRDDAFMGTKGQVSATHIFPPLSPCLFADFWILCFLAASHVSLRMPARLEFRSDVLLQAE